MNIIKKIVNKLSMNNSFLKKINLFKIFNLASRLFIEFLITFIWIRYFVNSLTICLLTTVMIIAVIELILYMLKKKKITKTNIDLETQQTIEDISLSFLFNDDKQNITFFYELASKKHTAIKKSKYVIVENPNSKIVLIPFFTYKELTCDNLIYCFNMAKNENPTKIIICTRQVDLSAIKLAKHIKDTQIIFLDKNDLYYKLLKPYEMFPEVKYKVKTDIKPTSQEILSYSLNRKRSKGYFFASLILLVSSFIVRRNLYYIIMASVLLILACVSFFNPKFNSKLNENLLD